MSGNSYYGRVAKVDMLRRARGKIATAVYKLSLLVGRRFSGIKGNFLKIPHVQGFSYLPPLMSIQYHLTVASVIHEHFCQMLLSLSINSSRFFRMQSLPLRLLWLSISPCHLILLRTGWAERLPHRSDCELFDGQGVGGLPE
jgi:hypothetical protein